MLATSFPPMLQLYTLAYTAVTRIALRLFRRYDAVRAVYLRRGGARGEILPLVSDIDFALISENLDDADRNELLDGYEVLVRRTTLLDKTLEIYDEEQFFDAYRTNDYARYRFAEGKKTWKLLYGRDYVAELPDLPDEEMAAGYYTEIKVWWALFAWRFFRRGKYSGERVTENNACFKTVSEILKMETALTRGEWIVSRAEALERAAEFLDGAEREFVRALSRIAGHRFRPRRNGVVDETLSFLLARLDRLYGELRSHPIASPLDERSHLLDYERSESPGAKEEDRFFERTLSFIEKRWAVPVRAARAVPGAYFNIDERLLVLEIDGHRPPPVSDLLALNDHLASETAHVRGRIPIFLRIGNAALRIDPDDLMRSWQSILFPPCNPDVFDLLARDDSLVAGPPSRSPAPPAGPAWTPLVRHFFDEEEMLFYELLRNKAVYKLNTLDFCRIFWKTAQLVVLNRSASEGTIRYAMTPAAISRELSRIGAAIPSNLLALDPIYAEAIFGGESDVGEFIPPALDYLMEIER